MVVPMDAVGCARSAIHGTDPVLPKLIAPLLDYLSDAYTATLLWDAVMKTLMA